MKGISDSDDMAEREETAKGVGVCKIKDKLAFWTNSDDALNFYDNIFFFIKSQLIDKFPKIDGFSTITSNHPKLITTKILQIM